MKILLADDSKVILELVSFNLRKQGHEVDTAEDGEELLKKLESCEGYDVVVTDNNMPKMNGIDVLRTLRADGHKAFPVIVYSGDSDIKPEVERLGGVFIDKLLSSGDLFIMIGKIAKKVVKENA